MDSADWEYRERPLLQTVTLMAHTLLLFVSLVGPGAALRANIFVSRASARADVCPWVSPAAVMLEPQRFSLCCPRLWRLGARQIWMRMRALARLIGFGDQAAQFEASVGLTNTTDPSGLLVQAALDSALARLTERQLSPGGE